MEGGRAGRRLPGQDRKTKEELRVSIVVLLCIAFIPISNGRMV